GQVRDGGTDRDLSFDLFRLEVKGRVARVRPPEAIDCTSGVEHRFRQARLAVVAMTEQGNVSNLVGIDSGHRFSLAKKIVNGSGASFPLPSYLVGRVRVGGQSIGASGMISTGLPTATSRVPCRTMIRQLASAMERSTCEP